MQSIGGIMYSNFFAACNGVVLGTGSPKVKDNAGAVTTPAIPPTAMPGWDALTDEQRTAWDKAAAKTVSDFT